MQSPLPGAPRADSEAGHVRHVRIEDGPSESVLASALRELETLPQDGVLEIELACDPSQLVGELAERSLDAVARRLPRKRSVLVVQARGARGLLDLTDLEAPLPMERILEAAAGLAPGESLVAQTPCFPRPLLAQLDRRGLDWEATEAAEGRGLVWVRRPA